MTQYLTADLVIQMQREVIDAIGGHHGVLNLAAIESAVSQPQATFDGVDLYPTIADKAAALGFSLITGHGFVDGNKRIGHVAMRVFA